jgi:thiol:disulfide interchange protein
MKKIFLFFLFFAVGCTQKSAAQVLKPAKWDIKLSATKAKIGETIDIIFVATLEKDWHLYAMQLPPDVAMPTKFTIQKHKSFALVGSVKEITKPITKFDKTWEANVSYFDNRAEFRQKIKILSKDFKFSGNVDGLTCSDIDGKCIPLEEDFELTKLEVIGEELKQEKTTKEGNNKPDNQVLIKENTKEKPNENTTEIASSKDTLQLQPASTDTTGKTATDTATLPSNLPANIAVQAIDDENISLLGFALLAFLSGFTALFTPCVFPMIPMTVSFFTSKKKPRARGILEALVYGFSTIGIYTFVGFLVSRIFGAEAANWIATNWIPNVLFFLVFVIFAISFFGAFEIVLPHTLVNKIDEQAEKGGFLGIFFMAFTLVLVSFSCTGPIVGSILVKSADGQVLKPVIGMLGFSAAFAIPFTLFALFPSWLNSLPKSGGWLNAVKVVLGFVELALALKFLSTADQVEHWGILPRHIFLSIWIAIALATALYLFGKIQLPHDSKTDSIGVFRLLLAITALTFSIYLVPGLFGSPLKALAGYLPPQTTSEFDLLDALRNHQPAAASAAIPVNLQPKKYIDKFQLPHGLKGYFDYQEALAASKALNKPIFIDFTGHGCVNCRKMEAAVWAAPEVLQRLKNDFIVLALYIDDPTELPENEWVVSQKDGKTKKTIGKINADLQITYLNNNAQPFYVLLGSEGFAGNLLATPQQYDENVQNFVNFLDKGKAAFQAK